MHIEMDDELVARIDATAGRRGRSGFIRGAVLAALEHQSRVASLRSARASVADQGHDWDDDPAAWVRQQRHADPHRAG